MDVLLWHRSCSVVGPTCARAWAASLLVLLVIMAGVQWGPVLAERVRTWWWLIQISRGDDR